MNPPASNSHGPLTTALDAWLRANVPGYAAPASMTAFAGGQSNPTFRIDCPQASFVLRRKPPGELLPSAHAVDREFKVISALSEAGFPVPKAWAFCADLSILGVEFYVMDLVEGRSLWDLSLPEFTPEERKALYFSQADTLAQLHSFIPQEIGLGDYGKPGNFFERQLGRWGKQYRLAESHPIAAMDELIERLPLDLPAQRRIAVVHGDFRLDNMIVKADAPEVAAVLDWELSTLGDPLSDFSYFLMSWVMPAGERASLLDVGDLASLGIPTINQMVERYALRAGLDDVPPLHWYFAFNLFRLASIVQGIHARARTGSASDPEALAKGARVEPLAEAALAQLDLHYT